MKIASITGVTNSPEFTVTKSISTLLLALNISLDEITTEKISFYVERANGNNVILANKTNLKDFILGSTYGTEAVQSFDGFPTVALCEVSQDGSIFLAEKETIKIRLEDLISAKTYEVYGIEEPVQSNDLFFFEQKSVAVEDVNKKIDVRGFDLAIMTLDDSVSDVSYTYSNNQVVKYLPFELQALSRDIDPLLYIDKDGLAVQAVSDRVSLPLVEVDFIEINKSQGSIINFVCRTTKNVS